MSTRKIYIVIFVLGLAMVWLGFLYTTCEQKMHSSSGVATTEQVVEDNSLTGHRIDPLSSAGVDSGSASVKKAVSGFPLVLAGLGLVVVLGGAVSYRQRE
ncbi:hypothetical protein [Cesiribacter andamanensis]|uniref:Uncharacterized protein n=1 Tax=Cesiribacter andamanensis AMV16 TaxID=1279009 RepID=M7N0R6_9BACT|nr:hypothetical protein [Cesiribacter andamanensis]EMR00791.1 hypothetical protein ADICEAN_04090 [Cesiribacter andamanensis AMV16]